MLSGPPNQDGTMEQAQSPAVRPANAVLRAANLKAILEFELIKNFLRAPLSSVPATLIY